ncbi:MAG: hypothetical protein QG594_2431 [Bacteroidota bacterium]|nr:hypothetical protein [Bacteroidota bacterium]
MSTKILTFKYQTDINDHAPVDCPPPNAKRISINAFRFVNNPITNDDFKTYIQLGKVPKGTNKTHLKCSCCGLSMFNSLEAAIKKYNSIPKKSNVSYSHIAEGKLTKEMGVCTPPLTNGHFDLFEFAETEIKNEFSIVAELRATENDKK